MRLIAILLFLAFAASGWSQLLINELMPSNVDCIMDDLNEFPDSWVELYNTSDSVVNLGDYRIGKKVAAASAWRLPRQKVEAHGHVLIYCDKEGSGLHTDFRLESDEDCSVFLLRGEQPVDWVLSLPGKPLPNTAYGRSSDGGDEWGYLLTPTPGSANGGALAKGALGTPRFSPLGRVQTVSTPFHLVMYVPEGAPAGTRIRYTLDGSEPTENSPLYDAPLYVRSTTIVRARLFCDGHLSPPSSSQSYIFFPHDRPLTLPVVSIATDDRYLYDPLIGIYTDGSYQEGKANYSFNWRRPVNIELFETSGVPGSLNQLCETRIFGGSSRERKLHSLVLYANKRFGTKRFNYEFFPDQRPGFADYKSIALRNGGNDYHDLYMRDAIAQRVMADNTDIDWQAWRPAIIYFNGEYMGMLNIRDRSNEDNVYTYHDGLEDIDLIANFGILQEGTLDHFNAFRAFYSEPGHTMAEYEQWMDCYEYINLMAMNIYHTNWDFPANNSIMWRPRGEGGRWRFIAKDIDTALGLYHLSPEYNYIEWLYNTDYDSNYYWGNRPSATLLFRHLMEDDAFRQLFIDRLAVYMGDFLNEQGIKPVWDAMFDRVKVELPYHRQLNSRAWSLYEKEMEEARSWLAHRAANVYQHLADRYHLGTPVPLTISPLTPHTSHLTPPLEGICNPLEGICNPRPSLTVNGIPLRRGAFDGMFFAGRQLTVEACSRGFAIPDGQEITGWSVEITDTLGNTTTTIVPTPAYTFDMPLCQSLALHPVTAIPDGITPTVGGDLPLGIPKGDASLVEESPTSGSGGFAIRQPIYSLTGIRLAKPQKGLNIVGGKKMIKTGAPVF